MHNKLFQVPAVLMLLASGCVADTTSIQIVRAMGNDALEDCVIKETDSQKSGGSLDLAYAPTPEDAAYLVALEVINNAEQLLYTSESKDQANNSDRNNFFIREIVLRYSGEGVPPIGEQVMKRAGTISPGGGKLFAAINIISPAAAAAFASAGAAGMQVEVGIKFRGEYANGSGNESNEFIFPLTVSSRGAAITCPQGTHVEPPTSAICGNFGQDGAVHFCAFNAPTGDAGL